MDQSNIKEKYTWKLKEQASNALILTVQNFMLDSVKLEMEFIKKEYGKMNHLFKLKFQSTQNQMF